MHIYGIGKRLTYTHTHTHSVENNNNKSSELLLVDRANIQENYECNFEILVDFEAEPKLCDYYYYIIDFLFPNACTRSANVCVREHAVLKLRERENLLELMRRCKLSSRQN